MMRLISIEWLKLSQSRYFRWMMGLWVIAFLAVPFGLDWVIGKIAGSAADLYSQAGLDPSILPIFSFTDLWHNFAYAYKLMTILLSIIVIVNVGLEWEEKTMRQNIIDGMSRTEYFFSKEILLLILTLLSTGGLFAMGLVMGYSYSANTSWSAITSHIDFLGGHALHVFLQLNIAMIFINLFKRTGVTVLLFLVYLYFLVPIFWGLCEWQLPEDFKSLPTYLPVTASWDIIPFPFLKYIFQETQEYVTVKSVAVTSAWIAVTAFINHALTTKRDLR